MSGVARTLSTLQVSLEGEGLVTVAVFITDEASAYTPQQVYSAVCVADDPALRTLYATVQSAGKVGELRVRLLAQSDDPFTVTRLTLNAPVPFVWQPFRMALTFAAAFALLCALLLRGRRAAYDPTRRSHRWIVALPLVGLMVFSLFLAQWIQPETPLFRGVTDEQAADSKDVYAVLLETLRSGRLAVAKTPDAALESLQNPYDQSERTTKDVTFSFDYAYSGGQFYIYYGVAPILTVYAPYRLLTGLVPASRDATLLMAWLTLAFAGFAVCGLARRYARGVSVWMLSLACFSAAFASGALLLLSSADFYYLAELSFVCFCAGSVGFGLHAAEQTNRRLKALQYALSGVCFALCALSRPSALPMLAAFLAPLYLCELVRKRARAADAAAFLLPAALGVGFLLWYNAARFGSAFDFGTGYQLTVTDMRWQRVRLSEWGAALYHYLLEPLNWINRFPYLSVMYHALPSAGRYAFTQSNCGILSDPIAWTLALFPLAAARVPAQTPSLRRERVWTPLAPLLVSLLLMLVYYGLAGAILRYTYDFRIFYILAGALTAMCVTVNANTPERKVLAVCCVLLCVVSVCLNFAMLFDNERDNILRASPQIYYNLQRMFFPY